MANFADSAQGRQLMNDSANDLIKAAPPIGVYAWQLFGHSITEVVSALTGIYLVCLIVQFGYRFYKWALRKP